MEQIINWLIEVENKAYTIYSNVALLCGDNKKLRRFFTRLADDEANHYHIMNSAAYHLKKMPVVPNHLIIDEKTKSRVEKPLREIERLSAEPSFDELEIVNCMVDSELSEWNDIFLYVIKTLKTEFPEFKTSIPRIQNHIRYVQNFLEQNKGYETCLDKLEAVPRIWEEKILIVDDFAPLLETFKDILSRYGSVDTAANGEEALEKAFSEYYAFILTDIDMPVMDGIEFYKNLVKKYPEAGRRIAFMSGDCSPERIQFLQENGLTIKLKPVPLNEIEEMLFAAFGIG